MCVRVWGGLTGPTRRAHPPAPRPHLATRAPHSPPTHSLTPAPLLLQVVCPANMVERRYSVWIGGSILASLGTFQQMWMSSAEYKEYGAGGIHKKAP